LITHDENREKAIQRMIRAIDDYQITGIETTLGFCKFVLQHEAFVSGDFNTKFVEKYFTPEKLEIQWEGEELRLLAALGVDIFEKQNSKLKRVSGQNGISNPRTNWKNRLI
jgi:propionyl-CoA carboxylase alpha chain